MKARYKPKEINAYTFGKLTFGGAQFTSDIILYPDRIQENWWRKQGHFLQPDDLSDVRKCSFDLLLIGTGAHGAMNVSGEVETWLNRQGMAWEAHPTGKACERYNTLIREGKRVVAALHLTC